MSVDNPEFKTSSPDIYLLLKKNARKNRAKMTEAETMLWERLRCYPRPIRFRRQHEQKALDDVRTEYLNKIGFSVIRFNNEQVVNHIDDVLAHIEELIYE